MYEHALNSTSFARCFRSNVAFAGKSGVHQAFSPRLARRTQPSARLPLKQSRTQYYSRVESGIVKDEMVGSVGAKALMQRFAAVSEHLDARLLSFHVFDISTIWRFCCWCCTGLAHRQQPVWASFTPFRWRKAQVTRQPKPKPAIRIHIDP